MGWEPKDTDIEWLRNLFRVLAQDGTWAIPATGQVFVKRGKSLVLVNSMDVDPDKYRSEEAQADMVYKTQTIGRKIGIEVTKE